MYFQLDTGYDFMIEKSDHGMYNCLWKCVYDKWFISFAFDTAFTDFALCIDKMPTWIVRIYILP